MARRVVVTRHRRKPFPVLTLFDLPVAVNPLAGWAPDWSWEEVVSPAEAVCRQIAADFDEATPVRQPILPGLVLRSGAIA